MGWGGGGPVRSVVVGPETCPVIADMERRCDSERGGVDGGRKLLQPVGDHGEGRQDGRRRDGLGTGRERGEELEEFGRGVRGGDTL